MQDIFFFTSASAFGINIPYHIPIHPELVLIDMILSNCITSISIIRFDSLLSDSDRIPMSGREPGSTRHEDKCEVRPPDYELEHTGAETRAS